MGHGRPYIVGLPGPGRDIDPCTCGALRGVRIAETATGRERITVRDGACATLGVLPVGPPDLLTGLLREALRKRGFVEADGKMRRTGEGGIEVVIELAARKLSVDLEREREIKVTVVEVATGATAATATADAKAAAEAALKRELTRERGRAEEHLAAEILEALEDALPGLQRELDEVLAEVAGAALEARARSLGEIESITGEAKDGTLTIRVRV